MRLPHRSLQLQEQIRQLTERKYELQQDEERSKQRPEEQREQLMAKIKRDNAEAEQVSGAASARRKGQLQCLRTPPGCTSSRCCPCCRAQHASKARELQDYIKRTEARIASLAGNSPAVNAEEEAAKRWGGCV